MKYSKIFPPELLKDYDLLWSNAELFSADYCNYIRGLYKIPFIVSSHANKSALLKSLARLNPDLLAVLTPDQIKYLEDYETNVKCIPAGVEIDFFKPERKKKYDIERPIFLSTASLFPNKRIHLIIKAISKLDSGSFVFTSTGPENNKLRRLANELLQRRHLYLGNIPRKDLPLTYNRCDYYVNASHSEGLSMSIFEAMACNLPVIYHDDETRRWQVGDGGFGTDVTDVDKFKTELCKATLYKFNDDPRKQAEKFSWDNTIKTYEKEIKKIL